jgi:hypothetical protein
MAIGPSVNALEWIAIGDGREEVRMNEFAKPKCSPSRLPGGMGLDLGQIHKESGTKTGGFNQADLIAPGGEFTALIALNHHTATGLYPNDAGSNPAKGGGFKHFYDIAGL